MVCRLVLVSPSILLPSASITDLSFTPIVSFFSLLPILLIHLLVPSPHLSPHLLWLHTLFLAPSLACLSCPVLQAVSHALSHPSLVPCLARLSCPVSPVSRALSRPSLVPCLAHLSCPILPVPCCLFYHLPIT